MSPRRLINSSEALTMPLSNNTSLEISPTISAHGNQATLIYESSVRHMQYRSTSSATADKPALPSKQMLRGEHCSNVPAHRLFFYPFHPDPVTQAAVHNSRTPHTKDHVDCRPSGPYSNGPRPVTLATQSNTSSSTISVGNSQKLRGRYYPPSVSDESCTIISLRSAREISPSNFRHRQSTATSVNRNLHLESHSRVASSPHSKSGDVVHHNRMFQTRYGFGVPGQKRGRNVPDAR